jgi:hypothetical protein
LEVEPQPANTSIAVSDRGSQRRRIMVRGNG